MVRGPHEAHNAPPWQMTGMDEGWVDEAETKRMKMNGSDELQTSYNSSAWTRLLLVLPE